MKGRGTAKSGPSVVRVRSWSQFRGIASGQDYRSWAFRGQRDASWPLFSSLSRYLLDHKVHPRAWSAQESRIVRIFTRKAYLLLQHLPREDDDFEWLALMQHHGAPTRLLDMSWSPYVAAYFALEHAITDAAVWAIFPPGLNNRPNPSLRGIRPNTGDDIGPWNPGAYRRYFLPNKLRTAVIGEPKRMNQRLIVQAGTFVMPGLLDEPVETLVPHDYIVKFVIDTTSVRREAMADLYNMNIGNATLFPGLDGLARSLAYELEHHWAFDPITMKKRRGF
jgi:hypothetical protein